MSLGYEYTDAYMSIYNLVPSNPTTSHGGGQDLYTQDGKSFLLASYII